ncbi:mitochondrial 37S ribosomal protein rsm10 [Serendipita sp. 396]|nr:mitochondrial 37S ribosomal protein rsm10 [Serendipita sp. 396]KAG8789836.1 mitochondrial 37S ribosomal protein rsm10 [Serendipita sp. 397]KAG8804823.1 mitochondrial 37S ribosomal protein rsm10 [Serendipita sp. 398]KAG8836476.1 mitochondrial 37S ribosomal protein rsm10 [Serendipita sp. 400]KAG8879492.1 mitochondrial 37S ribosomal protein rsm10 [Serendipita sp. 405]
MAFSRGQIIARHVRTLQKMVRVAPPRPMLRSIASTSKCLARLPRRRYANDFHGENNGKMGKFSEDPEEVERILDTFIDQVVDEHQMENLEYSILAGKLNEALEALQNENKVSTVDSQQTNPAAVELSEEATSFVAAPKDSDAKEDSTGEGQEGQDMVNSKIAELEKIHSKMTPAERVIDLLDRLSVAGQPLLQRIIDSEGKDLDHLLAELEADEAVEEQFGAQSEDGSSPSLPRDLVLNPNSMSWDKAIRKSAMSPTRAMMRGRKTLPELSQEEEAALKEAGLSINDLISMQEEAELDVHDEQRARDELTQWIEKAAEARTQIGSNRKLLTKNERQHLAQLLETATKDDSLLLRQVESEQQEGAENTTKTTPSSTNTKAHRELGVALDTEKLKSLVKPGPNAMTGESWFSTTPSIGLDVPKTIPRTHSIPVASLHFRSYFPHLVDLQTHIVQHSAYGLGIPVSKPVHLPTQRTLITVLRSPFIHKKSMENWERKTHKRAVKVWDCNPELLTGWLAWLERNGIAGVGMRVTRWEYVELDTLEADSTRLLQEVDGNKDAVQDSGSSNPPKSNVDLSAVQPSLPEATQADLR